MNAHTLLVNTPTADVNADFDIGIEHAPPVRRQHPPHLLETAQKLVDEINLSSAAVPSSCFKIDVGAVADILAACFFQASKDKVQFLNSKEKLVMFSVRESWKYITSTYRHPAILQDGIEAEDRDRVMKATERVVMDYVKLYHQRDSITWKVDMFTDNSRCEIRDNENDVLIVLPHKEFPSSPYDPAIIADYKDHFAELDDILAFFVAARFATDRKTAYLWLKAASNFGKTLFASILQQLGAVTSLSVQEVEAALEGKAVALKPDQFRYAFVLLVEEFETVSNGLKQLQNEITFAPKFQPRQTAEIFAKLFLSAVDAGDIISEHGVEDQYVNRMAYINKETTITTRPMFIEVGDMDYAASLRGYFAEYLNAKVADYRALGRETAELRANETLKTFHQRHGIGNEAEALSSHLQDIANDFHAWVFSKDGNELIGSNVVNLASGLTGLKNTASCFNIYAAKNIDPKARKNVKNQKQKIFNLASADGEGYKLRKTADDWPVKCIGLTKLPACVSATNDTAEPQKFG